MHDDNVLHYPITLPKNFAPMKRQQQIALLAAAINLVLVLLFPPYDYMSMQRGNIPTFDGFYFL